MKRLKRLKRFASDENIENIVDSFKNRLDKYDLVLISNYLCKEFNELPDELYFVEMTSLDDLLPPDFSCYEAIRIASLSKNFNIDDDLVTYDKNANTLTSMSYKDAANVVIQHAEEIAKNMIEHGYDVYDMLNIIGSNR